MSDPEVAAPAHAVSFREAAGFWIKLGFINFGGPAGQIALMHEELVERRRWITRGAVPPCAELLHAAARARRHSSWRSTSGGCCTRCAAGCSPASRSSCPAFFLIWGLSWTYAAHGDVAVVEGLFAGLQAAVVGIVAHAVIRIGEKALTNAALVAVPRARSSRSSSLHVPFPVIILVRGG